jgi:hypothetical protein
MEGFYNIISSLILPLLVPIFSLVFFLGKIRNDITHYNKVLSEHIELHSKFEVRIQNIYGDLSEVKGQLQQISKEIEFFRRMHTKNG